MTEMSNSPRDSRQSGASLVEFAILAPLLVLLLLGIIEFGWKFGQFNEVRHAVREGSRFAAVDGGDNAAIRVTVCDALDGLDAGVTAVRVQMTRTDTDLDGDFEVGEEGLILVEVDADSLTGAPGIDIFLPSTLSSQVEFRLEQEPTWTTDAGLVNAAC